METQTIYASWNLQQSLAYWADAQSMVRRLASRPLLVHRVWIQPLSCCPSSSWINCHCCKTLRHNAWIPLSSPVSFAREVANLATPRTSGKFGSRAFPAAAKWTNSSRSRQPTGTSKHTEYSHKHRFGTEIISVCTTVNRIIGNFWESQLVTLRSELALKKSLLRKGIAMAIWTYGPIRKFHIFLTRR